MVATGGATLQTGLARRVVGRMAWCGVVGGQWVGNFQTGVQDMGLQQTQWVKNVGFSNGARVAAAA